MWTGEQGARGCVEVQGLITGLPLCVSSCSTPTTPSERTPTPPHVWKNPIQLIRFFKMDQFLISGASDYGQYHCRWEDSCWTAVFIYRNVCFFFTVCRCRGRKWLAQTTAPLQSPACPGRGLASSCMSATTTPAPAAPPRLQRIQRSLIVPFGRSVLNIYSHQSRTVD